MSNKKQFDENKQRVLDKFYADMNFGFDSNLVYVEKVEQSLVYFSMNTISYIYDTEKKEITNKSDFKENESLTDDSFMD